MLDDLHPGHHHAAGALRVLGFPDRRSGKDRRSGPTFTFDPEQPRRRSDRRETPSGHIRNALQVLATVEHFRAGDGDRLEVEGVRRALWLALLEIERTMSRAG